MEETRALRLIRSAADEMQLPVFGSSVPLSTTRSEDVQALREWARMRTFL